MRRSLQAREPVAAPAQPLPPRSLVVVAHPDDEIIGAAGLLLRSRGCGVVHLTDGAPRDRRFWPEGLDADREAYARLRRREAESALAVAAIDPERIETLGTPDQEAIGNLIGLTRALLLRLRALQPPVVVVHAYEGGHPDHDAAALAAHAAAVLLWRERVAPPLLLEMTSYHGREGRLVPGEFLPGTGTSVSTLALTEEQRELKRQMLACHRSQREVLRHFPAEVERFRPAPSYDFTRPPHEGPLLYETLRWPISGAAWRDLARATLAELGLGGEASL